MSRAYYNCKNISNASCGTNVVKVHQAYYYCNNISGNSYFYSNRINNASYCFGNRYSEAYEGTTKRVNLFIPRYGYNSSHNTFYTFINNCNSQYIFGGQVTWTYNSSNTCYYNTYFNFYIYPTL